MRVPDVPYDPILDPAAYGPVLALVDAPTRAPRTFPATVARRPFTAEDVARAFDVPLHLIQRVPDGYRLTA